MLPLVCSPRTESAKRYPLLVWLHGYGENGLDNERQLKWLDLILDDPDHVEKYRFFILAVQCAPGDPAWYRNSKTATPADMLAAAMDVLHKVMQDYPVDLDRICLAGVSTGGSACWEMAMRYPDVFAAVVPMASWGGDVSARPAWSTFRFGPFITVTMTHRRPRKCAQR